jgi:RimJ/RimL family protein N-acetyltransferase
VGACPTLTTERLILRPFVESDLDGFTEIFLSPEVHAALHLPESFSRADAWSGMVGWLGQWELQGTGQWAVVTQADGTLVGRAGLHRPERADWPGIEVGWVLDPRQWGHGYATEAGSCAVAYTFEVIGADEVFSVILPENRGSEAVATRLGFTLVEQRVMSHFPDSPHGIWRLGRDEWESRPAPMAAPSG